MESEWISLRLMDSNGFTNGFSYVFINFALRMLWWSTHFYQCASWRLHWWQSTSHHVAFPSTDIHVWLPSQWYPSRRYMLHLDTWGLLYTISYFYSVTPGYYILCDTERLFCDAGRLSSSVTPEYSSETPEDSHILWHRNIMQCILS